MLLLRRLRSYLSSSLWVLPALIVLGAAGSAFGLLAIDRQLTKESSSVGYGGGPEGARQILSTISGAMITFTGLVFSITILVLQLAGSQYSPRVLRRFFKDRSSQVALGVFIGAFVFSLVVLREVRQEGSAGVPGVSVAAAQLFVVVALGVFVQYLHHIASAIRSSSIIESVALETRGAIEQRYPRDRTDVGVDPTDDLDPVQEVGAPRAGSLGRIDEGELIELAREAGAIVEVVPAIGDFVPEGAPLLRVYGHTVEELENPGRVGRLVELARERTSEQDPAFGFRQLVDIAERALSPGVNDPTTAVQAIDQLHDLLRRLARRPFPRRGRRDDDGTVRLVVREAAWEDYVDLAVSEIRVYGAGSLQAHRRLRAMIDDVWEVAPEARRGPLALQRRLLDAAADRSFDDAADRARARGADAQGMGA